MRTKIDQFLACKKFAVAGISRNKHKFGNTIYKELKKKNFDLVPVSPNMETFEGEKCYQSIGDLPSDVEALIIVTKPEVSLSLLKEAASKGINNIFLQQGAQNKEIIEYAENNGVNIICKHCILMFVNPSGIHKFHERISKFFGFYPN